MATEESRFFDYNEADPVPEDKDYDANEFAELMRIFLTDGLPELETNLQVTADDSGMIVNVNYGSAISQGYGYWLKDNETGIKTLAIIGANSSYARIDRVVLRMDKSTSIRSIVLAVKTGTAAADPAPPDLTREGNVYELSLAQVSVGPGVLSITADKVIDERSDSAVCGPLITKAVRDLIEGIQTDIENLQTNINNLETALTGKADASHTQAISTIIGLQDALNAKAAASHGHAISDVTNLQTTLNGKLGTGAKAADSNLLDGHDSSYFQTVLNSDQKRKVTISSSSPSGGSDGDVWLKYS